MLVILIGVAVSIPWSAPDMRVGWDFAAFWTAGRLALSGQAVTAYGAPGQAALAALFGPADYPPFFYPPSALLMWLPFALAPVAMGAALWLAGTGVAYAWAVRAAFGSRFIIPALSFPAVAICALYGQNSLLSAALLAGVAAALDRSPVVAGACIGLLAFKPQLVILAPLALVAAGRWRALAAAAVTVAALIGTSLAAFGGQAWLAFVAVLPAANAWNASGRPGFDKFVGVYATIRLLGGSEPLAWAIQGLAASAAVTALILIARKRPGGGAETAFLVMATGFCVPFLGDYDLVIFVVPAAWLASEAIRTGWLPYERIALGLLYAAPLAIKPAAVHGIALAPIALCVLAGLLLRRVVRVRIACPCDECLILPWQTGATMADARVEPDGDCAIDVGLT